MQVIEVPVFNDDGSINITQKISPDEAQALLQFAINFNLAMGFAQVMKQEALHKLDD